MPSSPADGYVADGDNLFRSIIMGIGNIIAIAIGLGADAMSVSAAIGVKWNGPRQKFRLAWHMGLFQFLMPILGWLLGRQLAGLLQQFGTYIAAGLVFAIGVKMLWEAMKNHPGEVAESAENTAEKVLHVKPKDPTCGWSLIVLSVATSLDALVVGVSLALKDTGDEMMIWLPSLMIGIIAAGMSLTGVYLGQTVGKAVGRPAEFLGALVLMGLGVSFLLL